MTLHVSAIRSSIYITYEIRVYACTRISNQEQYLYYI